MANTTQLTQVFEPWLISSFLEPRHPDRFITKDVLRLRWGGDVECDAIVYSDDDQIEAVYNFSSSEYYTKSGNPGPGKYRKILGDILTMTAIDAPYKAIIFTGQTMYEHALKQQDAGRIPPREEIEFIYHPLAPEMVDFVSDAKSEAFLP